MYKVYGNNVLLKNILYFHRKRIVKFIKKYIILSIVKISMSIQGIFIMIKKNKCTFKSKYTSIIIIYML